MNPTETSSAVETVPANDQPLAPFVLTERAVTQVKEIIRSQKFEGFALVIRVVPAGCNGLGYDLNMLKDTKTGDQVWEQDGVKIATDGISQTYMAGTEIDYVKEVQGSRFTFTNPKAKASCGCGTSFST